MTQLRAGSPAPAFTLPQLDGPDVRFLPAGGAPQVLIFYQLSCETCRYSLPLFDRLCFGSGHDRPAVYAVAQDPPEEVRVFTRARGVRMPQLLDLPPYTVSRAFRVVNVPTLFVVDAEGQVQLASPAFVRTDVEATARLLAESRQEPAPPLFGPEEDIPDLKPG